MVDRIEPDDEDAIEIPEPEGYTFDMTPETEVDPVVSAWAKYRDQFAALMNDGMWSIEELEDRIAAKQAIFFPGAACAIVGEIERFPTGIKVMHVTWAVGEMTEILAMEPGVAAVARMMGCKMMLVDGREGWRKMLEPYGYSLFSVTVTKAL